MRFAFNYMAITFQKKEKQQKKLILIFILLALIVGVAIWWGFFRIEIPYEEPFILAERPMINFEVLRLPILEKLEPFPKIKPFEQEIGRKNPFIFFKEIPKDIILD